MFPKKYNATKKIFFDFSLFWPFLDKKNSQKAAKIGQKWRKFANFKLFDKIFGNLVGRWFPTKENATNELFFDCGIFGPIFCQKTAKIDQKGKKLAKPKPFDEIF